MLIGGPKHTRIRRRPVHSTAVLVYLVDLIVMTVRAVTSLRNVLFIATYVIKTSIEHNVNTIILASLYNEICVDRSYL